MVERMPNGEQLLDLARIVRDPNAFNSYQRGVRMMCRFSVGDLHVPLGWSVDELRGRLLVPSYPYKVQRIFDELVEGPIEDSSKANMLYEVTATSEQVNEMDPRDLRLLASSRLVLGVAAIRYRAWFIKVNWLTMAKHPTHPNIPRALIDGGDTGESYWNDLSSDIVFECGRFDGEFDRPTISRILKTPPPRVHGF